MLNLNNIASKYYKFWIWISSLRKKTSILHVNFNKEWTNIIFKQKKYLFVSLTIETIVQSFYTITPYLIGRIIESTNYYYFFLLIILWTISIGLEFVSSYNAIILETQCINSVLFNSFKYFLTVDPIFHTQRQTGKLFAKIVRAARAYEDFLDIILWDIVSIIISTTTVIISFLLIDIKLGLISLGFLLFIAILNITLIRLYTVSFEPELIKTDDKLKTLYVESLTQIQLIRSYFASTEISDRAKKSNYEMMFKTSTASIAFATSYFITRYAYLISIAILGFYLISLVNSNILSITIAITLLLTYINGTYKVINVGRKLKKLLRAITRIKDLFEYVRIFGKQTFPVLFSKEQITEQIIKARSEDYINLSIQNLYFDYGPDAKIFENHNLNINVPRTQKSKLYGIIGPSGIGKTTLISILGGQLNPTKGIIKLNGINIYQLDDAARQNLIAVQAQIASSISGTLKSNLLLGIPKEKTYTDEQIIKVLEEVGIWKIFKEKEGLNSKVGESGLTLSGGQRQRLNFASLYLRAQYFRPLLILIDEPTSSLDEVSEKAITEMISKLSEHALTLVIAHRLRTLKDAVEIIDFTLIESEKSIKPYPHQELIKKSNYYEKLIKGEVNIEN